jgi:hypothetical protein
VSLPTPLLAQPIVGTNGYNSGVDVADDDGRVCDVGVVGRLRYVDSSGVWHQTATRARQLPPGDDIELLLDANDRFVRVARSGASISCGAVERHIASLPSVARARVVPIADAQSGTRLAALIEREAAQWRDALRAADGRPLPVDASLAWRSSLTALLEQTRVANDEAGAAVERVAVDGVRGDERLLLHTAARTVAYVARMLDLGGGGGDDDELHVLLRHADGTCLPPVRLALDYAHATLTDVADALAAGTRRVRACAVVSCDTAAHLLRAYGLRHAPQLVVVSCGMLPTALCDAASVVVEYDERRACLSTTLGCGDARLDADTFEAVWAATASDDGVATPIVELRVVSSGAARLLDEWQCGDREERDDHRSLLELVASAAGEHAEQTAVECAGISLSYAALWRRARALAARLRETMRHDNDNRARVAILLERSVDTIVAMLGVALSGACFVLIDTVLPRARRQLCLDKSAPHALITSESAVSGVVVPPAVATIFASQLSSE